MRRHKIYLVSLGIMILLSVVFGVFTRFSFANDVSVGNYLENGDTYKVSFNDDPAYLGIYFNNSIATLSQLEDQSDVIVKVRLTNERLNHMRAILSKVNVLDVYKGNDVQKGDSIYIYEPSNFFASSYYVMGGYNIMHEDQAYIVFLKHIKIPEGYRYKGNEAISFIPVSTYYGKYPVKSAESAIVIPKEKEVSYTQVKDLDVITQEEDVVNKYNTLKHEVLTNMLRKDNKRVGFF
jgi:hypothetical protein